MQVHAKLILYQEKRHNYFFIRSPCTKKQGMQSQYRNRLGGKAKSFSNFSLGNVFLEVRPEFKSRVKIVGFQCKQSICFLILTQLNYTGNLVEPSFSG